MIPKVIHYCWFGSNEKPKSVQKYIKNWEKMLPDFEIKEWNESNCNLENEIPYVKEAYKVKKYAFVSDYIRLKKLYEYGGIYFDTDIEVVKSFDECLNGQVVLGLQSLGNISTAFMATEKGNNFFKECLDSYKKRHFVKEDGTYDTTSINVTMDPFAEKYGLDLYKDEFQKTEHGITMYPIDYFSAFDIEAWHPVITDNTYTVHNMASSWRPFKVRAKIAVIRIIINIVGIKRYDKIRQKLNHKLVQ